MSMAYQKVKAVAKEVMPKGTVLEAKVAKTMSLISTIVGGTLGPGGRPVLIERQEHGLPSMVTKDGVTVFRSLGFQDATSHVIMEAARDASVRTGNEAGDGTTTATILAEAIVRKTREFCHKNPTISPQRVVRRMESVFKDTIEPAIKNWSLPCAGKRDRLHSVASISSNGDKSLADAVMECFDTVGDEGNVTILEVSGPSHYEVEQIDGYAIGIGFEDSCAKYAPKFINDPGTQRCVLESPAFIVYHGRLTDIQTCVMLMEKVGIAWQAEGFNHNVVIIATGFSESVLAQLAMNFSEQGTINVFPLMAPQSPIASGQLDFLEDMCAFTGATLLDPMNAPLENADLADIGTGCRQFECGRFRSAVIDFADEDLIKERVLYLKSRIAASDSILEKRWCEERIGKLTGGIAKLKVIGSSSGELREKRDRAEDAVCAVRGAIKHGCLPGGGWALIKLRNLLTSKFAGDPVVLEVLVPSLRVPVEILFENIGMNTAEIDHAISELTTTVEQKKPVVYDAMENEYVEAIKVGLLDSTPAVLEAIRNSLSIATLLGTLGGTIVFSRDLDLERTEARDTENFLRTAEENPANERP